MPKTDRPDMNGAHRAQYAANRKYILATQSVCAWCGRPVDKSLKSPHPMSPTVDHIFPVSKGGHPSDIDNLQLMHRRCNREKSDKVVTGREAKRIFTNRDLPQSANWKAF